MNESVRSSCGFAIAERRGGAPSSAAASRTARRPPSTTDKGRSRRCSCAARSAGCQGAAQGDPDFEHQTDISTRSAAASSSSSATTGCTARSPRRHPGRGSGTGDDRRRVLSGLSVRHGARSGPAGWRAGAPPAIYTGWRCAEPAYPARWVEALQRADPMAEPLELASCARRATPSSTTGSRALGRRRGIFRD